MLETTANVLTVDGRQLALRDGDTILQAMLREGMEIAHVCYHPQIGTLKTCDACIVETGKSVV